MARESYQGRDRMVEQKVLFSSLKTPAVLVDMGCSRFYYIFHHKNLMITYSPSYKPEAYCKSKIKSTPSAKMALDKNAILCYGNSDE